MSAFGPRILRAKSIEASEEKASSTKFHVTDFSRELLASPKRTCAQRVTYREESIAFARKAASSRPVKAQMNLE